jgi:hypothetical protein
MKCVTAQREEIMPNWVDNEMSIETDESTISRIKHQVTKIGEHEDIEGYSIALNLYPLPHDLQYVSGTGGDEKYFILQDKIVKPPKMDEDYFQILRGEDPRYTIKPLTTGERNMLMEKHGAVNWYDWNVNKYGTKWGDVETELRVDHDDYLKFTFRSAWAPAHKLAENMSKDFKATITLKFYSIENGDEGKVVFKNGRMSEQSWKELEYDMRQVSIPKAK